MKSLSLYQDAHFDVAAVSSKRGWIHGEKSLVSFDVDPLFAFMTSTSIKIASLNNDDVRRMRFWLDYQFHIISKKKEDTDRYRNSCFGL